MSFFCFKKLEEETYFSTFFPMLTYALSVELEGFPSLMRRLLSLEEGALASIEAEPLIWLGVDPIVTFDAEYPLSKESTLRKILLPVTKQKSAQDVCKVS